MEMATTYQTLAATRMPALGMDPMLYQGRCSAWQQVVSNLPSITEIPKESIIANTDFTTTSVIAKRRLSSKKWRKLNQDNCGGDGTGSESSNQSPVGSSNASPAITLTTSSTPPSVERSDTESIARSDSTGLATVQLPCLSDEARLSQTTMVLSSSSSREGQIDGRNKYMAEVSSSSLPSTHQNAHQNVAMRIMHSQQITNSVLSQIQQGLNYRFLQEQSMLQQHAMQLSSAVAPSSQIEHPQPLPNTTQKVPHQKTVCSEFDRSRSGFKWCMAHVIIAKQIQQHRKQRNGETSFLIHAQQDSSSHNTQQHPHHIQHHQHPPPHPPLTSSTQPLPHPSFPPQHTSTNAAITNNPHMALMQYNLPASTMVATAPPAAATAAAAYPPRYLAVPYSFMQDLQLQMQQSLVPVPTQLHINNGLQMMKPIMSESVVGLNLGVGVQVAGGLPPSLQQVQFAGMAPGAPLGQATNSSLVTSAMVQGPAPTGSWMTPTHGVNSCMFNNPFQPGIMAAP